MKFLSFLLIVFSTVTFAQKTINTDQNADKIIYDDVAIIFEPGSQIIASNKSMFFAYINKFVSNNTLSFEYDLSGNQIKRYFTITISSRKLNTDNIIYYDKVELVQEPIKEIQTVFQVYPNPTPGPLNIKWNTKEEVQDIQLYDLTGKEVKSYQVNKLSNNIEINISNVPAGVYVLKFITSKGEIISKKIIKK